MAVSKCELSDYERLHLAHSPLCTPLRMSRLHCPACGQYGDSKSLGAHFVAKETTGFLDCKKGGTWMGASCGLGVCLNIVMQPFTSGNRELLPSNAANGSRQSR